MLRLILLCVQLTAALTITATSQSDLEEYAAVDSTTMTVSSDITITSQITISGDDIVIEGSTGTESLQRTDDGGRILNVTGSLTLRRITIKGGYWSGDYNSGGCLYVTGDLVLDRAYLTEIRARRAHSTRAGSNVR